MRRTTMLTMFAALAALLAPTAAFAGNEGAPWSAPIYLSEGAPAAAAEGPSLGMLADGSLVATWNQRIDLEWFPEMASEPFAGAWSEPSELSSKAIAPPTSSIGGVRTAVDGDGRFVSAWLGFNAETPNQYDVDGAYGSVTPGDAPASSPYTFAEYSPKSGNLYGGRSEGSRSPQVVMSSDGNGTIEYGIGNLVASAGTYTGLTGIAGGVPTGAEGTPQAAFEYNPGAISGDISPLIPSLATSGLNSSWDASLSDEEVLEAAAPNGGLKAKIYTTSDPADWSGVEPIEPGISGYGATAAVLANGNILVANENNSLNVWESGQETPTLADSGDTLGAPAIATYFDGSATIAYQGYEDATNMRDVKEVTVAADGTVSEPVTLSAQSTEIPNLTVAYGPDGTTYVVWSVNDSAEPADDGIYASVRLPEGQFPTIPDTVIAGPALAPKIEVDQTGFATIVAEVSEPGEGYRIAAFTHSNPRPPILLSAPTVSPAGTPTVGTTLTCSNGKWTNQPTTFTYEWLRAGSPIGGAQSQTYTLVSADAGQQISCRVTATNSYGSGIGTSAAITVSSAQSSTKSSSSEEENAQAGKVKSKDGKVSVSVSCPATSTQGCAPTTLTLTVVEELEGKKITAILAKHAKKHKRTRRTVVIARATVTLKAGQSKTVTLTPNAKGRSLLKSHPHLKTKLSITSGKTTIKTTKIALSAKPAKKHKPKHH
ncbi:MAG TPA: hypothetical protein VGF95_06730 [Solirubrobacteraceae bacterium]|jgi:hypothetical protein